MMDLKFLELLFPTPKICPSCHKDMEDLVFCQECKGKLREFASIEGKCTRCGTYGLDGDFCENCKDWPDQYLENLSAVPYLKEYEKIVKKFKFGHGEYLRKAMGILMTEELIRREVEFDIIIPIPVHRASFRERGYNQASLLAKEIGHEFSKEVRDDILQRGRKSQIQAGLNRRERLKNLEEVFSVYQKEVIINKRVLLVDDVITTGVTLKTASEMLIFSGARETSSVTFAAGYLGGRNYGS